MTIAQELQAFYQKHGFGDVPGKRPKLVQVYTGCMLVPLPNIEARRRFLKYHDLHHLITGYSVGRIGEGEVSAWELGTGSMFASPMLGIMNLIALSTGFFLQRGRMWQAFKRGCRSRNLYSLAMRKAVDTEVWNDIDGLRKETLEIYPMSAGGTLRTIEFSMYVFLSMIIHGSLVIPAIIARFVTDTICGGSIFAAAKPKKRVDLY